MILKRETAHYFRTPIAPAICEMALADHIEFAGLLYNSTLANRKSSSQASFFIPPAPAARVH